MYRERLAPHVRDLLVERKTTTISRHLTAAPHPMVAGLDLGCGQGSHAMALARAGYRLVGVDPSVRSLAHARRDGAVVAAGSALRLPFRDGSFDFVYAIGVLHHLAPRDRHAALGEVRRVLVLGGRLLVHETNPRNPVFRFYMAYVFPIVRRIDEGTEEWLEPGCPLVPGLRSVQVEYSTFLPDFVPRWLLPVLLPLERRLEGGRWRSYAAHYLEVFDAEV